MQVELEIMEILKGSSRAESKVDMICEFMSWDRNKLTAAIVKHGTSGKDGRVAILKEFWNKDLLKNKE